MAPERSPKRQKTSSDSETLGKDTRPSQIPLPPESSNSTTDSLVDSTGKQQQRSSWYATWSRKATPVAQVARDSLQSASDIASEVAATVKDVSTKPKSIRSPSLAMTLGRGQSSRASLAGSPVDATTTMVHAEANSPARKPKKSTSSASKDVPGFEDTQTKAESMPTKTKDVTGSEAPAADQSKASEETQQESQISRSGWLNWLTRGDGASTGQNTGVSEPRSEPIKPEVSTTSPSQVEEIAKQAPAVEDGLVQENQTSRRSWIPLWSTDSAEKPHVNDRTPNDDEAPATSKLGNGQSTFSEPQADSEVAQSKQKATPAEALPPFRPPQDGNKATGWAFWSRDRSGNGSTASVDKTHEGEIAISDTPSQDRPRKTSISVPKTGSSQTPEPKKPEPTKPESTKLGGGEQSIGTVSVKIPEAASIKSHKKQDSKSEVQIVKAESSNATAVALEPTESKKPASIKADKVEHNLLLPSLHTTLKLPETPSLLLRLANLLYAMKEPELRHLSLVKDPPQIKNALAIGVHGYFPAPLIRSVLGQPTGTSIKFADMAVRSIKRWTSSHGYQCEVKSAALEGEGKISERIELLWKLLLNWIEEIRKSDFIMIACHSQGVPVAIMLVAKLIQFGCINTARVCICAMAGVNMGPFPEYKSRWIGGSAGELFEFSDPSSRVSTDYLAALDVVLKFGVRLTFIGSIDDQLVSLESSIFSPISHPHIFRAVSIDSRVHAPNFLSHLVGFALKLRNLGVQDHGLIRELSSPLAGSLYTGEGHSRIYEDDAVYDLAVAFSLETTALVGVHMSQRTIVSGGSNPYILPFAMRGILEEDFVKNDLQGEASDLLKEFDEWKPTSKALKDVKFRLEGIRSKL